MSEVTKRVIRCRKSRKDNTMTKRKGTQNIDNDQQNTTQKT
jgi:hypothetical protein